MSPGKRRFLLFIILPVVISLLTAIPVYSQNLKKIEKKAIQRFKKGNFVDAKNSFLMLFDAEWNKNSTCSYLAKCYLELHQPQKSYEILKTVPDPDQNIIYLLILSNYSLEKFKEADELLRVLEDTVSFDVSSIKQQVDLALETYNNQKGYMIQNFGPGINTEGREYSAVMYNDYNKLLYTSRKETGLNTAKDGLAYETIYSTEIDSADNWKKPEPLDIDLVNDKSHDATVQVYQSGRKLVSYRDGRLYISEYKEGTWQKYEDLDIHGLKGSDTHCFMTNDEKTLFFASDYLTEGLHLDLFVTYRQENGKWSDPVPLDVFNTEFDEDAPFLASDSTFYFSSRGHNSMGGYDIFKSTYDSVNKTWGTPVNMGFPINTVAEDTYYSTDGKIGYLSSTREGGYGSLDLYRVFLFNKVKVEGVLYNKDQKPMTEALININYDSTTLTSYTDENGYYEMFVPVNKKMHITFIKDSLDQFEGEYIANIFMKDQNNNEFNFFIDYVNPEGQEDEQSVKHINIEVKNDYKENPIVASTTLNEEKAWTDSINTVTIKNIISKNESREVSIVREKGDDKVDIESANLSIRDATVKGMKKESESSELEEKQPDKNQESYTIQVLALSKSRKPADSYFDRLDSSAHIDQKEGNDGFIRFFVGEYLSRAEALRELRQIRKRGYNDAFLRKISQYSTL